MGQPVTDKRPCKQCGVFFVDRGDASGIPRVYCSTICHEADAPRKAPKPKQQMRRSPSTQKRRPISAASSEQREKVAERACVVCREPHCDPAHLIPRGMLSEGQDDPRAVIPLCRAHHDEFDHAGTLDLLPYLEPWWREELAFAVERVGLMATLRRVTGSGMRLEDAA